jgi:hypothetical protein
METPCGKQRETNARASARPLPRATLAGETRPPSNCCFASTRGRRSSGAVQPQRRQSRTGSDAIGRVHHARIWAEAQASGTSCRPNPDECFPRKHSSRSATTMSYPDAGECFPLIGSVRTRAYEMAEQKRGTSGIEAVADECLVAKAITPRVATRRRTRSCGQRDPHARDWAIARADPTLATAAADRPRWARGAS